MCVEVMLVRLSVAQDHSSNSSTDLFYKLQGNSNCQINKAKGEKKKKPQTVSLYPISRVIHFPETQLGKLGFSSILILTET